MTCLPCAVRDQAMSPPGGILYRTGSWFLTHAIDTPIPGFLVLSCMRHVESLADLSPDEGEELGWLLPRICGLILETVKPERVHCCCVGENIRHVHWYFFPRMSDMAGLERGVAIFPTAVRRAKQFFRMEDQMSEILGITDQVRAALSTESYVQR